MYLANVGLSLCLQQAGTIDLYMFSHLVAPKKLSVVSWYILF